MNQLLELAVTAHGGLARWKQLKSASVNMTIGGALWRAKGVPDFAGKARITLDVHEPKYSLEPFLAPDQRRIRPPQYRRLRVGRGFSHLTARDCSRIKLIIALVATDGLTAFG